MTQWTRITDSVRHRISRKHTDKSACCADIGEDVVNTAMELSESHGKLLVVDANNNAQLRPVQYNRTPIALYAGTYVVIWSLMLNLHTFLYI